MTLHPVITSALHTGCSVTGRSYVLLMGGNNGDQKARGETSSSILLLNLADSFSSRYIPKYTTFPFDRCYCGGDLALVGSHPLIVVHWLR